MVSFSLKVRFYETDLMGVVHHANYLRWFEMGRVEYLRQAGIDLNEMMGEGFMVPIVDVNCRYRQSARAPCRRKDHKRHHDGRRKGCAAE